MRVFTWLGHALAIGVLAALALNQAPRAQMLAITSVNVIDVSAATPAAALLTNRTVIITGNRITAIGEEGSTAIPAGARRLDGRGKYLIPGLWDMHAHALTEHEWALPLFVANGVIGIREMGTILPYDRINEIRRGLADGSIVGPRIGATTARILDGVGGRTGPMTPVATGDDGRRIVREYKQNGIDFVKPYNLLERETYLAIVDEARRQGLPVSGHVPNSMTAAEASDAGQIGIEHLWDVFVSSSRDEAALRQQRLTLAKNAPAGVFPGVESKAATTYDDGKASALFARFVKNRTAVIPTLVFFEVMMKSAADMQTTSGCGTCRSRRASDGSSRRRNGRQEWQNSRRRCSRNGSRSSSRCINKACGCSPAPTCSTPTWSQGSACTTNSTGSPKPA